MKMASVVPTSLWTVKKQLKKPTTFDSNLTVIEKILDPTQKFGYKIVWICVLFCCLGLCLYQVGSRIESYIQGPTTFKLEIRRLSTVEIPSVILCSSSFTRAMRSLHEDYSKCNKSSSTISCNQTVVQIMETEFKSKNTSAKERIQIVSNISHDSIEYINECSLFSTNDNCNGKTVATGMKVQYLDTIFGYCVALTLNKKIEYRGPFTWLALSWNNSIFSSFYTETPDYYFFLQPNASALSKHDAIYLAETALTGYETTVRLSAREFTFLNSKKQPCTDDIKAVNCFENCVERLLRRNLPCQIPLVNETRVFKPCKSPKEVIEAYARADDVYSRLNSTSCTCKRRCHKMVYKINVDGKEKLGRNLTKLKLLYSEETQEVLVEEAIFSFSELVSEIGGSIGLYLGICVFTVFELIENVVKRFCQKCFIK